MRLTCDLFHVMFAHYAYLTLMSREQKKQLMDAFAAEKAIPTDSCIKGLSWTLYEKSDLTGDLTRGLTIENLWNNNTARQLKCHSERIDKDNVARRYCVCAENLRNGKCKDAFMRRTFGAVLFPKLYGKDKQK